MSFKDEGYFDDRPNGLSGTPDPSPSNAELREAIWQAIKGWDLERSHGEGYAGATGTDVQTILDAIDPVFQAREQQLLTKLLGELPTGDTENWLTLEERPTDYIIGFETCHKQVVEILSRKIGELNG